MIEDKKVLMDRYEKLILQRDAVEKKAESYLTEYVQRFGDKTKALFELQVECIKLKKKISYCQAMINRGVLIDVTDMDSTVEKTMASYYEQLREMTDSLKAAKGAVIVSADVVYKVKKIYHELVKKIHPDINPKTKEDPELAMLWNNIVLNYKNNDLKKLREYGFLVDKYIEEHGGLTDIDEIPDIEEKIEALEIEIADIINTEPYTFKDILDDIKKSDDKEAQLDRDLKEYTDYKIELEKCCKDMLIGGGMKLLW